MKISTYIFISFLFILLLFSITTFINYRLSEAVAENSRYFSKSTEIMKHSSRFQRNTLSMVSGLRGYLLTGEKYFIASYDSSDRENEFILQDLASLIDDSLQTRLLNDIKELNDTWVDDYAKPLKQAKALSNVNDSNLTAFKKLYKEELSTGEEQNLQQALQEKFRQFTYKEYDNRAQRSIKIASSIKTTGTISFTLTVLSLVMSFVVVSFLIRQISRRISQMVNMADHIASGEYKVHMHDVGNDELSALVHSLNHMANELNKSISELETKNKELNQFAHIVSHDLKSPLRGIDNVISWIEEDHKHEIPLKIDDYLQTIKGRVRRAENLIQGILSYARVDSETIPKEMVDLNLLLQDVLNDLQVKPGMHIETGTLPVIQNTERIPLFQVFSNLIGNAIKHNDKPEGKVSITFTEYKDHYVFSVSDNGPGIAEVYHDRVFVIFQTLKERDSFESTGVGLAIVKKILDARKEQITINSTPGKGTTFSFTWHK